MFPYQYKILSAAVIASLSLSACGKKKDLYEQPANASVSTTVTPTPSPTPNPYTDGTTTGGGISDKGELPAPPKLQPADGDDSSSNSAPSTGGTVGIGSTKPGAGAAPSAPSRGNSNGGSITGGALPPPPLRGGIAPTAPATGNQANNQGDNQENQGTITNPNNNNDGGSINNPNPVPANPQAGGIRPANPLTPNVVDTKPLSEAPTQTNNLPDYDSKNPASVDRTDLVKRITGGQTQEGLLYTSSSTDGILDFLRARNEKVSYNQRQLNKTAAATVTSALLNTDSGEAIITLKIAEGNDVKVYNLAGSLGEGSAARIRSIRSGNQTSTTGTRPVAGTIKCLDFDGGCENSFLRLQIGEKGENAVINIVFRQSSADLFFSLNPASGNNEYDIMRDLAYNTIQNRRSNNKVDLNQVRMNSYEVVNGRSGFTVAMRLLNNEFLAFAGPLLAPEAGTSVNIPLARVTRPVDASLDLFQQNDMTLNYQNMIADARLIANSSLGQLRVSFKMRNRGPYTNDRFAITYSRKIKPIVELNDDNLK